MILKHFSPAPLSPDLSRGKMPSLPVSPTCPSLPIVLTCLAPCVTFKPSFMPCTSSTKNSRTRDFPPCPTPPVASVLPESKGQFLFSSVSPRGATTVPAHHGHWINSCRRAFTWRTWLKAERSRNSDQTSLGACSPELPVGGVRACIPAYVPAGVWVSLPRGFMKGCLCERCGC